MGAGFYEFTEKGPTMKSIYDPVEHEDLTSPGAAIIVSICVAGMVLIGLAFALMVWGW